MAKSNKGGLNKRKGGPLPRSQPSPGRTNSPGTRKSKDRDAGPRGLYETKEQAVREARRRGGEVVEHRPSGKVIVRRRDTSGQTERPAADAPSRPRPTAHVTPAPGGGWRVESRRQPSAAKAAVQRLLDELPERELGEVALFLEYLRWRTEARRGVAVEPGDRQTTQESAEGSDP